MTVGNVTSTFIKQQDDSTSFDMEEPEEAAYVATATSQVSQVKELELYS